MVILNFINEEVKIKKFKVFQVQKPKKGRA